MSEKERQEIAKALIAAESFIADELENREAACFDSDPPAYLTEPKRVLRLIRYALAKIVNTGTEEK